MSQISVIQIKVSKYEKIKYLNANYSYYFLFYYYPFIYLFIGKNIIIINYKLFYAYNYPKVCNFKYP